MFHWRCGLLIKNPLRAKCLQREQKHIFTFYVIPPHWHETGSWNPSSSKTRTYLFYIVNIMGADVLGTQGARHQQPWYCQCWKESIWSPHVKGIMLFRDTPFHNMASAISRRSSTATLTIWPWWRHYMFKRFFHNWTFVRRRTGNWSIPLTKSRPVTRSLDVLFSISMNKLLNKLSNCRWFETPRHPYDVIWRHCFISLYLYTGSSRMFLTCPVPATIGIWSLCSKRNTLIVPKRLSE